MASALRTRNLVAARKQDSEADLERIAEILVEGFRSGNWEATAKRRGISSRTMRNWKQRLDKEPKLAEVFRLKKDGASKGWLDEAPKAMQSCIEFIDKAAREGDHKNPLMVHSIAGALKLTAEVTATWRVLEKRLAKADADARGAGQDRPVRAAPGSPAGADGAEGTAPEQRVH